MSTSTPGDPQAARPGRLSGWKEIAAYLDRGVRTVQRWEKTLGLPVRRIGTGRGEVVYAITEELDAWRDAAERTRDLSESLGEHDGEEAAVSGAGGQAERSGATSAGAAAAVTPKPPAPEDGADPPLAVPPAEGTSSAAGSLRRWRGVALVLAAGLAVVAFLAWREWTVPTGEPADYVMDVDTLRVLDAHGREIWNDRFPAPATKVPYEGPGRLGRRGLVSIIDFDGDGSREVFVGYTTATPGTLDEVRGYKASGERLFSRTLAASVRFGDTDYSPPWSVHRVWVTPAPGGGSWLWVVWVHGTGEFPSLLQRLSIAGKVQSELWSAGFVEAVFPTEIAGRPSVLVGAANNDHKGGSLALFDADAVAGSMPAETWDKTCRTCQPGGPRKVLVFPRLDVLKLTLGIPSVETIRRQETGEFRVSVDQGAWNVSGGLQFGGTVAYDLASDLTPVLAEFGAEYLAGHERHHAAGLLDHPFNDADRAAAWPVLVWENGKWTKVTGRTDK